MLTTYLCRVRGYDYSPHGGTPIVAESRGKAKTAFLRHLDMDVKYTDVTAYSLGKLQTSERFRRNAIYRGVPFAYVGMRVRVGDKDGVIVGHNSSANLDVMFKGDVVLNCHPNWEIAYFHENGEVAADFRKLPPSARDSSGDQRP